MQPSDIIIVGAGPAGSVLAAQLSTDPRLRVTLIEAGPGGWHPFVSMPRGWVRMTGHPRRAWGFAVEPEAGRPDPEIWARGRGLGGSSSINGMIWCRGAPQDYDSWSKMGVHGWDWPEMERAFRAVEDRNGGAGYPGEARIRITQHPLRGPLGDSILSAGAEIGLPPLATLYGGDRPGIGPYSHSIGRDGVRSSAAKAFLTAARHRPNLRILTGTEVERLILMEDRACGVIARRSGQEIRLMARAGVILCAGALKSPQILQLSGLGPGAMLREAGVPVLHDMPAVGAGLAEHLVVALPYQLKRVPGHNPRLRGARLVAEVARYILTRRGLMALGGSETGAFLRSCDAALWPDLQLAISPYAFARSLMGGRLELAAEPGITATGYMLRPTSRGTITLSGPDLRLPPKITANWLSTPGDCATAIAMMGWLRRLMGTRALQDFVGDEIWPGATVTDPDAVLSAFRGRFVSGLHATGTCAMGTALDSRLRVKGIAGLWVADAGAIPAPVSGNTNGPVTALAWRGAELIREDLK